MLVASGPSASDVGIPLMEEHVLERISAIEYSLNVVNKRLDAMMETIERVAASNFIDHTMIETLTDTLEAAGIDLRNLERDWRRRIDSTISETQEADRLTSRLDAIMESYRGSDHAQFALWMEKCHELLLEERVDESLHFLKLAFEHDSQNLELGMLISELYIEEKNYAAALKYLDRVIDTKPDNFRATFLSGIAEQKIGELDEAQSRLERAVGLRKDSPLAHATLASLLGKVGKKKQALKHFSMALKLKPNASIHFAVGELYYKEGQSRRAIEHLKRATELDPHYGEAFYQLGLLCLEMNWPRKAQQCFKTAQTLNPREKRYRKRVQSFSGEANGPDQLNRLFREEMLLQYGTANDQHKRK